MNRKVAMAVVGTLSLLVLASPAPALAADECPPLVQVCASDTVTPDPDDVLDDPIGTVVDVVGGAENTTGPVVDPVVDVVNDVLNGGDIVQPPGGGPRDHDSGPGTKVQRRDRSAQDPITITPRPSGLSREALRSPGPIIGSAASGTNQPIAPDGSPGRSEGFAEGAVRSLLILAVLFGVTVGFLVVQGRLDRNDPKLIGAPVRTEVVTFG
jgi:hypothetical protein